GEDKLIGAMLTIVEPAKRGRYLTIPGGPIIDWKNKDLTDLFVSEIKRIAKEKKCVFIRVRPQLISDEFSKSIFISYGFKNAPIHLHAELTSQLDVTKSEEGLIKSMRKTTRYELKKAGLLNIKVEMSKDFKEIKKFYDLQVETSKRQGFVPFSYQYLYE